MGVLDQVEAQRRARVKKLLGALAALAVLAAGAAIWYFNRDTNAPASAPAEAPAEVSPAAALFARGRPGTLRPAVLDQFGDIAASSADPARLGAEIDGWFYYPQHEGLKGLRGVLLCPYVLRQMKVWMAQYGLEQQVIDKAELSVNYSWDPERGLELDFEGWPEELQPLERKRHLNILRDMTQLVVPPTHSSFLTDYKLDLKRRDDAILIKGTAANENARLRAFRKLVFTSGEGAWMEGAGEAARFESLTRYQEIGGKRVIAEIATFVDTNDATLRYTVTPIYKDFGGILLPVKFNQIYVDDQGAALADPLELTALGWEIAR